MRRALVLALVALAAAAAGCGDDEDTAATAETAATEASAPAGGGELKVTAEESGGLSFAPKALDAPAGEVTIVMDNPEGNTMPHAVEVEGNGIEQAGDVVQGGGTSTVSADLEPGTYAFYCPVGSHRQAGMEGTLTVK